MSEVQKEVWLKQMRSVWEQKDTEELLAVWRQNDRNEWIDDTFEVIRSILLTRIGGLPPQDGILIDSNRKTRSTAKRLVLIVASIALAVIACLFVYQAGLNLQVLRDETRTVSLTQSTHPKRLVDERDIAMISVGYDQFLAYVEAQRRQYEGDNVSQGGYAEWQKEIEAELRDRDIVTLNTRRDERFIADMLEQGKASVFDKRNQSYVATINMRIYEYRDEPFHGYGYRYFYLPDRYLFNPNGTQFLEVMDWEWWS